MMQILDRVKRYVNTIKYLKPVQIYGRVWFRLYRPRPSKDGLPNIRKLKLKSWAKPPEKHQSQLAENRFTFLNQTHDISKSGWDASDIDKLWRYNLHYFDDLNAQGSSKRRELHQETIAQWIDKNPPFEGTGWEPYPTSLRIVNWTKWVFAGNELSKVARDSLALQARFLNKRLEYHLLGNHLLANAKALIFAGVFYEGREAENWLNTGLRILFDQIGEQILDDGGHFELSPMYHSIVLEDLLDVLNLISSAKIKLPTTTVNLENEIRTRIPSMLNWLNTMSHPDGKISFFNDAAFGIVPEPQALKEYAKRLAITSNPAPKNKVVQLIESGFIRVNEGNVTLIVDAAKIGPDYLPGHAHADTLSFELSIDGHRLLVNSGTSIYGTSEERLAQRGTVAHNTLSVGSRNSSNVWHGFRVAERAYPFDTKIRDHEKTIEIESSHDGYKPLTHKRNFRIYSGFLKIDDLIRGENCDASAWFHFHPDIEVAIDKNARKATLKLPDKREISFEAKGEPIRVHDTFFHPEFGKSLPNKTLELPLDQNQCSVTIGWDEAPSRR